MPDTAHLYSQVDEAEIELAQIKARGALLRERIEPLLKAFGEQHRCNADDAMEHIKDALDDLVSDAQGPAWRRKCRIENEIGNIEERDLRRSSPMVL